VSAKKEAQGKTAAVIAPQAKQPTASNGKNHEEVEEEEEEDDEEEEEEEEYEVIELRERADWDCASIVSTYSNTENHPSLIAEPGKPRIQLSKKTGMPLGVLPVKHKKEAAPVEPRGAHSHSALTCAIVLLSKPIHVSLYLRRLHR
jgi:hypothetical protein